MDWFHPYTNPFLYRPYNTGDSILRGILIQCAGIKSDKRMKEFYLSTKGGKEGNNCCGKEAYAYWILKKNVTYKELILGRN
ncbi:MAG: hypothetical protein ACP5NC_03160 [Nitrososphaeria archaeon]